MGVVACMDGVEMSLCHHIEAVTTAILSLWTGVADMGVSLNTAEIAALSPLG